MQVDWRAICGPALATATALIAIAADRTLVTVPNPAPLFVCIVALAASLSGLASGMVSAAIAVTSSALFFLNHRATAGLRCLRPRASGDARAYRGRQPAVITGVLRQKMVDAVSWEQARHATAARLASALDQIDIGVVLLDKDTRAGIHQPRLPRLFFIARREGRLQAAGSSR